MFLKFVFMILYLKCGNISDKLGYIICLIRNLVYYMGKVLLFVVRFKNILIFFKRENKVWML